MSTKAPQLRSSPPTLSSLKKGYVAFLIPPHLNLERNESTYGGFTRRWSNTLLLMVTIALGSTSFLVPMDCTVLVNALEVWIWEPLCGSSLIQTMMKG